MSKIKQNNKLVSQSKRNICFVELKANLSIEYYAISKDMLEQLNESLGSSIAFDLSLFFFALSVGIFTTIFTTEFKNTFLFSILLIGAASMFVIGVFKYMTYRKNKKKVSAVLKKIKNNKCSIM